MFNGVARTTPKRGWSRTRRQYVSVLQETLTFRPLMCAREPCSVVFREFNFINISRVAAIRLQLDPHHSNPTALELTIYENKVQADQVDYKDRYWINREE